MSGRLAGSLALALVLSGAAPTEDAGLAEVEQLGVVLRLPPSWSVDDLRLERVEAKPPAQLPEALAHWTGWMSQPEVESSGALEGGGFYTRVRHVVREGSPGEGATGFHKHHLLHVAEVAALMPVGASAYVQFSYACDHQSQERCDQALTIAQSLHRR